MKTLDIKIKHREKIKSEKENLYNNDKISTKSLLSRDSSEKADSEFHFFDSTPDMDEDDIIEGKVTVLTRAKIFKQKFLTRMTSLVQS